MEVTVGGSLNITDDTIRRTLYKAEIHHSVDQRRMFFFESSGEIPEYINIRRKQSLQNLQQIKTGLGAWASPA
jgi:hypothetical protein